MSLLIRSLVYALIVLSSVTADKQHHKKNGLLFDEIGKNNWEQLLEGEWMIKFYLKECLTCGFVDPVWEDLAHQKKELGIKVGKMHIADAPDLKFLDRQSLTYKIVPALYHVKNGVFRQYKGQIHQDLLTKFILKKIWKNVAPIDVSNENMTDLSSIENPKLSDDKIVDELELDSSFAKPQLAFLTVTVVALLMMYLSLMIILVFRNAPKANNKDDEKPDVEDRYIPDNYMGYEKLVNFLGEDVIYEKINEPKDVSKNNKTPRESKLPAHSDVVDGAKLSKKIASYNNLTQPNEYQTHLQLKKILFPEKYVDDEKNFIQLPALPVRYSNLDNNNNNHKRSNESKQLPSNAFYKAVHKLASDFNRIENPRVSAKKAVKIDYLIHYTKITSSQQKHRYKKEFYAHYAEYLKMHHRAIKISQQFKILRKRMKRMFGRGNIVEYEEVRRRFLEKYFESRDIHERYYYLHNKLRYIKKLVAEYEAECSGDGPKQEMVTEL